MTESLETSEGEALPYKGNALEAAPAIDPITRAIELLREGAKELALGVSIGEVPDWANEPDAMAAHDELLMVARALELLPNVRLTESELVALQDAARERDRLRELINTPELFDFDKGAFLEAVHQLERWSSDHDGGKEPTDWFWLVAYLSGKALHHHAEARRLEARGVEHEYIEFHENKAVHHVITSAAALKHWHNAVLGRAHTMRPGIETPQGVSAC